jgi:hypothetical protein
MFDIPPDRPLHIFMAALRAGAYTEDELLDLWARFRWLLREGAGRRRERGLALIPASNDAPRKPCDHLGTAARPAHRSDPASERATGDTKRS